jgi:hypothetical protein
VPVAALERAVGDGGDRGGSELSGLEVSVIEGKQPLTRLSVEHLPGIIGRCSAPSAARRITWRADVIAEVLYLGGGKSADSPPAEEDHPELDRARGRYEVSNVGSTVSTACQSPVNVPLIGQREYKTAFPLREVS